MTESILDALDPADARRVLAAGRALTLPQGWSPIAESTPADKAYLITEGEVSVRKGGVEIAILGPGSVVGEGAVVHFTRDTIEDLVEQVPSFGTALRAAAAGRLEGG